MGARIASFFRPKISLLVALQNEGWSTGVSMFSIRPWHCVRRGGAETS